MSIEKKSVCFLFINGPHHVYHLIEPALSFASTKKDYKSVLTFYEIGTILASH